MRPDQARSVIDRIRESVIREGDCLVWIKKRDKNGYGHIRIGSRTDGSRRTERVPKLILEMKLGRSLFARLVGIAYLRQSTLLFAFSSV